MAEKMTDKAREVLILYESFLKHTIDHLTIVGDLLEKKQTNTIVEKLLDIRCIGAVLIIMTFSIKYLYLLTKSSTQNLSTTEFICMLAIGTILLILGTYFKLKEAEKNRDTILRTAEIFTDSFIANIEFSDSEGESKKAKEIAQDN